MTYFSNTREAAREGLLVGIFLALATAGVLAGLLFWCLLYQWVIE